MNLKRDIEQMRLIACLPDIYLKTRTKRQLCELLLGIDNSARRYSRQECLDMVFQYKKEINEQHKKFKLYDELQDFRRQINQLLKAVVNPSAIAGYHPDLDKIQILNRMNTVDFSDYTKPQERDDREKSVEELWGDLWQDNPGHDELDEAWDQKNTEDLGLLGKVDWEGWQEKYEQSEPYWGVVADFPQNKLKELTEKAESLDDQLEQI